MTQFPKPWRLQQIGEDFRVFDANNRHLFVITSDEFLDEDEKPEDATVLGYGTDKEVNDLYHEIELMFTEDDDG